MDREQIQYVPIERVTFGTNVRQHLDEQSIAGLALTMREFGVQQPLRVRRDGDKLKVIFGHRRVLAAKRAGVSQIPVIIEDREMSHGEVTARQLLENCQRKNLSATEAAYGIKELMGQTGWLAREVAKHLGLSPASVSKLLSLLSLPPEAFEKVESGKIPASTAYEITKVNDPAKQAELAAQATNGQLTRDGVTRAVKRSRNGRQRSKKHAAHRATAQLGGGRSITFHGAGLVSLESMIGWLEELLTKCREALPQSLSLAAFLNQLQPAHKSASNSTSAFK